MIQKHGLIMLKGFGVGASMLVPGVSGGSMAIILGIYDQLIHAVASFNRDIRHNTLFLALFTLGGLIGMLAAARPLLLLITRYPTPALYFFSGAVAGSMPMLVSKARLSRLRLQLLLWPLLGVSAVLLLDILRGQAPSVSAGAPGVWYLFTIGLVSAVALVLPGLSVSYVWLIMGMYDAIMRALGSLQISYLVPLALGLFPGIFLCSRLLEQAMRRFPGPAYLSILGFLLGSLIQIFPGLPDGIEWLLCPLLFALGSGAVIGFSRHNF